MVDAVFQNIWVLYHINEDECYESLPLLACNFSKILKGSQNVPSDVCYEVHINRCHLKNKACVRCARITSDATVYNVKQIYMIYVLKYFMDFN